MTSRFWN